MRTRRARHPAPLLDMRRMTIFFPEIEAEFS